MEKRFCWPVNPVALPENTIVGQKYRFTVLLPGLIRMEYSPDGVFEDRASQTAFYRDFPKCEYTYQKENGILTIETESFKLTYRENMSFSQESLQISLLVTPGTAWKYGCDFEDLGGTVKTLDTVDGAIPLGRGVVSQNGFSVLDDSQTLVLEEDGWVGVRRENTVDAYFFGFGHDYLGAVQALYKLTGMPPMLPAYALGNWWSRYHAYTQQEYCDLMERFREEDVPFSVGVVDMDWHIVKIPEELKDMDTTSCGFWDFRKGWTGYSWNKELFPDYKAFLKFLKKRNLHTALNLHPHAGVCRHEDMYEEMAKKCGVDPKSGKRIPFNILSKEFMANYFDVLHHPYEEDGVDFWWMDWQQGTDYWWIHKPNQPGQYQDPRERMDPLWMLNHLHILDITRNGKRPLFFSRYAGPGSHRYPVGFSGDTVISWESLNFQPYFTACASNVGYSWWSHDVGGHMGGNRDDELVTRWMQLGVFSPINRLHSSDSPFLSKEPWCYGFEEQEIMKKWLRLRHSLFPYLYTMNYRNHTEGVPLVLPMYYTHPECKDAYKVPNQYWFGSQLMVAPITEKIDKASKTGKVTAWLPKGDWFDFFTGLRYYSTRGRKMNLHRDLRTIPVLAKAGAIIPMAQYDKQDNRLFNSPNMEVAVFPGANGSFTLYEDGGDYETDNHVTTQMTLDWEKGSFTIAPAQGDVSLIPQVRTWKIILRGFHKNVNLAVNIPDAVVHREDICNSTVISVTVPVNQEIQVTFTGENLIHDNADVIDRCFDLLLHSQIGIEHKEHIWRCLQTKDPIHQKMHMMSAFRDRSISGVMGAIRELLTLTQDEYDA